MEKVSDSTECLRVYEFILKTFLVQRMDERRPCCDLKLIEILTSEEFWIHV